MYSKVKICNLALLDLGANPISSIDEAVKEATHCKAYWDMLRDEVLASHTWSFAKKWASLAESASYTIKDERYDYAYQIPTDYIRPVRGEERGLNYERRGDVLMSNESPLVFEYIWRLEDTTLWPIYFDLAVAARLRARLSIPLSKKGTKSIDWYKLYLLERDSAMTQDALQSRPTAEEAQGHTADTDAFLQARK